MPDPTGNDQSIEPGQRECTALVEMPNFIPKIEFITVANWFRTSEVGDGQKSDLEKGVDPRPQARPGRGGPQPVPRSRGTIARRNIRSRASA